MNEFIYNEETRQHTLDGKIIPSVSQIIEPLNDFEGIPEDVLERKAELGIEFHKAIRLHLLDDLDFDNLDPDLVIPMDSFVNWWSGSAEIIAIEQPVYHKSLKYCGCPDLYVLNTEGQIYDWKLRDYMPIVDRLKLMAYKHMITKKKVDLYTICFDMKGGIRIWNSYHPKAWGIFRRMLERYYSELEFNALMESWGSLN